MASDRTPTHLRGLILPAPVRQLWEAQSGEYDAGGTRLAALRGQSPIPGQVEDNSDSDLQPIATGTPEAATVYLRAGRGGMPGQDEAALLWSDVSPAASLRGCDLPQRVSHCESIYAAGTRRWPHACPTTAGHLIVYWQSGVGICTRAWTRGVGWGSTAVLAADPGYAQYPCLLRIPRADGTYRIHLYFWFRLPSGDMQVRLWYSDDDGATWASAGDVLQSPLDSATYTDFLRLRAGYVTGQVFLSAHCQVTPAATYDVLVQWATAAGGQILQEIDAWDGSTVEQRGGWQDVAVLDDVIYVAWLGDPDGTGRESVVLVRLAGVQERIRYVERVQPTAGPADTLYTVGPPFGGGDLALWADDDGSLYVTARDVVAGHWLTLRSPDGGRTLVRTGPSARATGAQQWHDLALSETPAELCAFADHGRTVLIHGIREAGALLGHLTMTILGGWSTVTLPHHDGSVSPTCRTAYERTWYGWSDPSVTAGWVLAAGVGGAVASDRYVVPAGDTYTLTAAGAVLPGSVARGLIWEVQAELDDLTAAYHLYLAARIGDGVRSYGVELRIGPATQQLRDTIGGAAIATVAHDLGDRPFRALIAIAGSSAQVWVLPDSGDPGEDRVWLLVAQTSTLTAGAPAAHRLTYQGLRITYWDWYGYVSDQYTADHLVTTRDTQDLYPRAIRGAPAYIGDGISVHGLTGPCVPGDTWSVGADYEYPPAALDPAGDESGYYATRSWPWRSPLVADMDPATVMLRVAWDLSATGSDEYQDSGLLGAFISSSTLPPGTLVRIYYGGAWTTVATLVGDTWTVTATGRTARTHTVGTDGAGIYLLDELAGAVCRFSGGGGVAATIESNAPGSTIQGAPLRASLRLDTTPAAGVQTVTTWPRDWWCAIRLSAYSQAIRGLCLDIPVTAATTPPAGYYEAGIAHLGPIVVWGHQYSWGRALTLDHGAEVYEAEDRSALVSQVADVRRGWEVSWSDPVDAWNYYASTDPDWVGDGVEAVAYWASTALDLMRQVQRVGGPLSPVVYLPSLQVSSLTPGAAITYLREAGGAVYSRLLQADDGLSLDAAEGGDEETGEPLRVQRVTGTEIS